MKTLRMRRKSLRKRTTSCYLGRSILSSRPRRWPSKRFFFLKHCTKERQRLSRISPRWSRQWDKSKMERIWCRLSNALKGLKVWPTWALQPFKTSLKSSPSWRLKSSTNFSAMKTSSSSWKETSKSKWPTTRNNRGQLLNWYNPLIKRV